MGSIHDRKKRIRKDVRYTYLMHIMEVRHIRKRLMSDHLSMFEKLLPILFDVDVINIQQSLDHGFRIDDLERHYAPEAAEIALRLDEWKSSKEMEKGVRDVLGWWLGGLGCNEEVFAKKAARDGWNAWRAYRSLPPEEFPDEPAPPPRGRSIPIYVD